MTPKLSIIIPTFNEMKNGYLKKILKSLEKLKEIEIICVDSYSTDGTLELIQKYAVRLVQNQTTSRGERLSIGARMASSNLLFLHHPRTLYENAGFEYLKKLADKDCWGGFSHKFDSKNSLLAFTSWYSNKVRADKKSIFYLDHGIYVSKSLLEQVNYLPTVDIFEDTYLSLALRKIMPGQRLSFRAITSSIRFETNGVLKQIALNQYMKFLFFINWNDKKLNNIYEKNNALNSNYPDKNKVKGERSEL